MAEKLVTEIQEDFLTCQLCKKPYSHPKALPCLHSFCRTCLFAHAQENAIRAADDGALCFFCPTCKQVVECPKGGIDAFQDNPLLSSLLDVLYSRTLQTCDVCKDVEQKRRNANFCCMRCEDFLCEDCAANHKRTRVTRDHFLINVSMIREVCLSKHDAQIYVRVLTKIGNYGPNLYCPVAITTNTADDIIVSNGNDTITIFGQNGECKRELNQRLFYGAEKHFLSNKCVAITTEGYIAVALRKDFTSTHCYIGIVETLAGRQAAIYSVKARAPQDLTPHGITITPDNYTIITDVNKHCFYIFNQDMELTKQVGKRGKRNSQFKSPYFVTTNGKNEILISDYDNHCVKAFDMKGKFRYKFGEMGRGQGQLMHPMGLCTDRANNVFVCDRDNHRVQMFAPDGKFMTIICQNTCRDGNDVRPQDLTMTSNGHLVVLVSGIEGVKFAEIHILQVGVSRFTDKEKKARRDEVAGQLADLRRSMETFRGQNKALSKPTPKQKANVLPPIGGTRSRASAPLPPDLLTPNSNHQRPPAYVGPRDYDYPHAAPQLPSSVCTIL